MNKLNRSDKIDKKRLFKDRESKKDRADNKKASTTTNEEQSLYSKRLLKAK